MRKGNVFTAEKKGAKGSKGVKSATVVKDKRSKSTDKCILICRNCTTCKT